MATIFRTPVIQQTTKKTYLHAVLNVVYSSLLLTTLAIAPVQNSFTQLDWPNPIVQPRLPIVHSPQNLLLSTLFVEPGAAPFSQLDWLNPFRYRALIDIGHQNLLETTLAEITPFSQLDWPLFKALNIKINELYQPNIDLFLTPPSGDPFKQSDWPILTRQIFKSDIIFLPNLLETVLAQAVGENPFFQIAWPNPQTHKIQRLYDPLNLLLSTLAEQIPFSVSKKFTSLFIRRLRIVKAR